MQRRRRVKIVVALMGLVAIAAYTAPSALAARSHARAHLRAHARSHARAHAAASLRPAVAHFLKGKQPLCVSGLSMCADPYDEVNDQYVGHDEPSLLFKSGVPGSGNDMTYTMTLPTDPSTFPNASGANSSTWNFQLHPTFWFGLTLCDSQSSPEFTKKCTPDSDANDLVGTNPAAPDYIGKHPGNAFMELQFYGPGYVPQFEGFGCTAHQYCAAMTIDSRTLDQNTGVENTAACNNYILGGPEPINWAYITKSGKTQEPANPLATGTFANPNFAAVDPNLTKDLFMNPGDRIRIHMYDTAAGFRVDLTDLTTGQSGSMTASVANGFGHILYTPDSDTCKMEPYAFHPEYSTANPRGNTWSAHTYNVAMSDGSGISRTARRSTPHSTAPSPARRTPAAWTRTTATASASRAPTRCSSRSTGASATTRTGTASPTRTTGRGRILTRCRTRPCTRRRCCSRARARTAIPSSTRRSRSRPTCLISRRRECRTTRPSATG